MACKSTQLYLFATGNTINKSKIKPTAQMKVVIAEFPINQEILFRRKDSVVRLVFNNAVSEKSNGSKITHKYKTDMSTPVNFTTDN
jgi:hypothetical protein